MARGKRRGRIKVKKVSQRTLIALACLLIAAISLPVLILIFYGPGAHNSRPAYEEAHPVRSGLHQQVSRIDAAIYDSLYRGAVPDHDVFFVEVRPRFHGEKSWNFTEILIRLRERAAARELEKILAGALDALGPAVDYTIEKSPELEKIFHVKALGFYTHRFRLNFRDYRKALPGKRGRVALIVDDIGYDKRIASALMGLGLPITLSVLPRAPYTPQIILEAERRGVELILHLPMEPKNYPEVDPGPGALMRCMGRDEIREVLKDHFSRIPAAKGVNNHMGSCFTEDREKMEVVLGEIKKRGLFFIDSRTSCETVGLELARSMGIPAAERSVFLDNDVACAAVTFQLERLLGISRHSRRAIGIGHPYPETLAVLQEYLPRLKQEVEVVPASHLVLK